MVLEVWSLVKLRIKLAEAIRSIKTCITNNQRTVTVQSSDGPREMDADLIASAIIREARERTLSVDPQFDFSEVRVGCPAEWDREQRIRLQGLLRDAGIDVPLADILDEPVAAAISWIDQRQRSGAPSTEEMSRLVVFDYGGGTLDIAVCEITWKGHHPEITVLSCDGVTDAGDRLDQALADHVMERIKQEDGVGSDKVVSSSKGPSNSPFDGPRRSYRLRTKRPSTLHPSG